MFINQAIVVKKDTQKYDDAPRPILQINHHVTLPWLIGVEWEWRERSVKEMMLPQTKSLKANDVSNAMRQWGWSSVKEKLHPLPFTVCLPDWMDLSINQKMRRVALFKDTTRVVPVHDFKPSKNLFKDL